MGREIKETRIGSELNLAFNVMGHNPQWEQADCAAQWQQEHLGLEHE